jgi:hypothetical protein
VAATERGICSIEFGDDPPLPAKVQEASARPEEAGLDFCGNQNVVAFIERPGKADLLSTLGHAFQQRA